MKEIRNLLLTLSGLAVSVAGSHLWMFAIGYYILDKTGSPVQFSISLIVSTLPRIILNPIAGTFVDQMNKKVVVILTDLLCGLVMLVLYAITLGTPLTVLMIYVASACISILSVFLNTAYMSSLASIVTEKYITKLNSYQESIVSSIEILAPIVGGLIYAVVDIRLFILINGISYIISAVSECFIDFKLNSKISNLNTVKQSFVQSFKEGYRFVRSQKALLSISIYAFVLNFFLSSFNVIYPVTLKIIDGFNADLYGIVIAMSPVGAIIASLVVGHMNLKFTRKGFALSMISLGVFFIAFSIPTLPFLDFGNLKPYFYGLIFILISFAVTLVNVPLIVKLQTDVKEEFRGRFFGFYGMMAEAVVPISYIITGFFMARMANYYVLTVVGICLMIISFNISKNQSLDDDRDEDDDMDNDNDMDNGKDLAYNS